MRAALLSAIAVLAAQVVAPVHAQTVRQSQNGVRLIAPDLVAPPPGGGGLERLPALQPPPAPQPRRAKIAPEQMRLRLLPLPIAESAGVFIADGYRIALAGLGPSDPAEMCGDTARWNCGAAARTAFRAFLRGRSLRCRVPDERPSRGEAVVTECTLGGRDVAAWLVENGWARRSGEIYVDEEARARERRRGFHGAPAGDYVVSLPSISAQVSSAP